MAGGLMSVLFDGFGGPTTAGPQGDGTTGPAPQGVITKGRGPHAVGRTGPSHHGVRMTGAGGPAGMFATSPTGDLWTGIGLPPGGITIIPPVPLTTRRGPHGDVTTDPIGPGMTRVGPPGMGALSLPAWSLYAICQPQGDATTHRHVPSGAHTRLCPFLSSCTCARPHFARMTSEFLPFLPLTMNLPSAPIDAYTVFLCPFFLPQDLTGKRHAPRAPLIHLVHRAFFPHVFPHVA
jgi:hypothetical protein